VAIDSSGCCSQPTTTPANGSAVGDTKSTCCGGGSMSRGSDFRSVEKKILAVPPHQRQRERSAATNSAAEPPAPLASSCPQNFFTNVKSTVLYSVEICGYEVPLVLLAAAFVGLWFLNPTVAIVFGVLMSVLVVLSRIRGSRSSGGYRRVASSSNGSRVHTVKDLAPMPRKGGG